MFNIGQIHVHSNAEGIRIITFIQPSFNVQILYHVRKNGSPFLSLFENLSPRAKNDPLSLLPPPSRNSALLAFRFLGTILTARPSVNRASNPGRGIKTLSILMAARHAEECVARTPSLSRERSHNYCRFYCVTTYRLERRERGKAARSKAQERQRQRLRGNRIKLAFPSAYAASHGARIPIPSVYVHAGSPVWDLSYVE